MSELSPLIEEALQNGGEVILTVAGRSMLPMLRHRKDRVCIVRPSQEQLKKYELPLYIRGDGKYILHRVVEERWPGYVVMGDNQYMGEYPVLPSQIIGVVKGFWRKNRYIACDSPGYLLYCRLWCFLYPVRRIYQRNRNFIKRHGAFGRRYGREAEGGIQDEG
jgi:hypothetical protein